jgi:hypothetical protein
MPANTILVSLTLLDYLVGHMVPHRIKLLLGKENGCSERSNRNYLWNIRSWGKNCCRHIDLEYPTLTGCSRVELEAYLACWESIYPHLNLQEVLWEW